MKIGGPPSPPDPAGRLTLEQAYGGKAAAPLGATLGLEPGMLLKGRVMAEDGAGMLTVLTERGTFKAATTATLEVGREFWFQVAGGGGASLALADKTNATFDLLRLLLPELLAANDAVSPPKTTGAPLAADSGLGLLTASAVDATPNPLKLLRLVSELGLLGPAARDDAGRKPQQAAAGAMTSLLNSDDPALRKLGRLLEAHAQVNQQPPASGGNNYWLFPVFFAGQAGQGEWMFSQESGGSGAGEAAGSSLSFFLAMSRLGEVHLALSSRLGQTTGVFTLATPEAAAHVRQNLPELCQALETLAGKVNISCQCAPGGNFSALRQELSAKAGLLPRFSLVDVTA